MHAMDGDGPQDSLEPPDSPTAVVTSKLVFAETLLNLLITDGNFTDFSQGVLVALLRAVRCEAGAILEVDDEHKVLFFRAAVGSRSSEVSGFRIPFGKGIAGHVLESKTHLIVNDMANNPLAVRAIQNAVGFEPRNMATFPIFIRGKVFAIVEFLNRQSQDESGFTATDVEMLAALCSLAAKALETRQMLNWICNQEREAA